MSDSDEETSLKAIKRVRNVNFGNFPDSDHIKKESGGSHNEASGASESGPNINVSNERMELDKFVDPHKEAVLAEFERRKRARQLTLPTDDGEVKSMLRSLDQPICLFGEDKPDRRERFRNILSNMEEEEAQRILRKEEPKIEKPKEDNTTWYHPGSEELVKARIFLAHFSLPRAKARLERAKIMCNVPSQQKVIKLQETHKWIRDLAPLASQVDNRPFSHCKFSPDSRYVATAGWNGLCKLWTLPNLEPVRVYKGHQSQAGCVEFHPQATLDGWSPSAVNLASCGQDGSVFLWNLEQDEPLADIEGHEPYRVSKLAFHPSGRFLATCCFDHSWRLFDLEANEEILFQEGHSKAVFDISFQCDGSVCLTGGLDCYGRVWDLRTGRCIMFLEGHQKSILSVQFSPNGYQMATGSADNTCKIWDLRMRRIIYTIPAHQNLVSKVCYDTQNGDYLVTGSYDNEIKIWSNPGWQPLKTLRGHSGKVMCLDVSANGKLLVSASYDRSFKLWAPDR